MQTFLTSSAPYEVEYEFGCEPYTVVPRAMAHEYEERFVGYGKDRVSWNYELAAKRVRFWVPPEGAPSASDPHSLRRSPARASPLSPPSADAC